MKSWCPFRECRMGQDPPTAGAPGSPGTEGRSQPRNDGVHKHQASPPATGDGAEELLATTGLFHSTLVSQERSCGREKPAGAERAELKHRAPSSKELPLRVGPESRDFPSTQGPPSQQGICKAEKSRVQRCAESCYGQRDREAAGKHRVEQGRSPGCDKQQPWDQFSVGSVPRGKHQNNPGLGAPLGHCCDPARDRETEKPQRDSPVPQGAEGQGGHRDNRGSVWGHRAAPAPWQGHPHWGQAAALPWCHRDRCHCNHSWTRSTPAFLSFLTNRFQLLLPPPGFALSPPGCSPSTARAEQEQPGSPHHRARLQPPSTLQRSCGEIQLHCPPRQTGLSWVLK